MAKIIQITKKSDAGLMYFQVWHNKENTASFQIDGVSNVLDDRSDDENYHNTCAIIQYCKDKKIPCSGVMVHNSNGCYFHSC